MTARDNTEYTTRETSHAPYNRLLEVSREERLASGLIVPADIAVLSFEYDPERIPIPEGISLPSAEEVFIHVMSKRYDSDRYESKRFQNIEELHDSLTQFVVLALTSGRDFALRYSDAASEDEIDRLRMLARTQVSNDSSDEEYGRGLYL